ncbi:MAG: hypothetical protein JNK94_06960, partial [Hyphomonadaceae bacterium]|nr:hypothetical protein [Hyphomonadaceae bacterium]
EGGSRSRDIFYVTQGDISHVTALVAPAASLPAPAPAAAPAAAPEAPAATETPAEPAPTPAPATP